MLLGKIKPEHRNTPGAENNPDDAAEEDFIEMRSHFKDLIIHQLQLRIFCVLFILTEWTSFDLQLAQKTGSRQYWTFVGD